MGDSIREDAQRLDGNTAAGLLQEVFALEMTGGRGACSGCGGVEFLGAQPAYVQAPGTVVRCRHCDHPLAVVVRGPGRYWLSLEGLRWLELRESGQPLL